MHACHFILSLFFFLTFYFFFLCFVTLLFHAFLSCSYSCVIVVIVVVVMLWISPYDCCCVDNLTIHDKVLYTTCHDRFFTILPLNHFCLGVGVLSNHPLVCQLSNHHHLPVLPMSHSITRQRKLFCLLIHRGIPIQNKVDILSHYPSWHAPSDSNSSFSLLGGMSF